MTKTQKFRIGYLLAGGVVFYLGASSAYLYLHMRKFKTSLAPDPYGRNHKVSTKKHYSRFGE